MNISWVFADTHSLDPTIDVDRIKNIGSTWGGWRTWRSCGTDNVICSELDKARELIKRNFQNCCNFYTPRKHYESLSRPTGVRLYDGDFDQATYGIEDIIAMHLAAVNSDVVLLLGFDLSTPVLPESDQLERHKILNRHGLIRSAISTNNVTQWVAIDHPKDLDRAYQVLPNLTCDQMENVIQLLV
jgi:hypothetical protein